MDVVSFAWSRSLRVGALNGLAISGSPENDGHFSPWQEAVGHEVIPDEILAGNPQVQAADPFALRQNRPPRRITAEIRW
jgi:hypothetical protein